MGSVFWVTQDDLFKMPKPQVAPEQKRKGKRKRQPYLTSDIDPKTKKFWLFKEVKFLKGEILWSDKNTLTDIINKSEKITNSVHIFSINKNLPDL